MMALLEPLIKQAIMQGLQHQTKAKTEKFGAVISLSLFASFFVFTSLFFLLYALFNKLLTWYTVPEAALAMAIIAFFLSLFSGIGAAVVMKRHHKNVGQSPDIAKTIQQTLAAVSNGLEQPMKDHPGTALLLAGLAGYLTNKHFH